VILGGNNDYHAIVTFNWNSMEYTTQPEGEFITVTYIFLLLCIRSRKKLLTSRWSKMTKYYHLCTLIKLIWLVGLLRSYLWSYNLTAFIFLIGSQFHLCCMSSSYTCRSQKSKKDIQVVSLFLCFWDLRMQKLLV